MAYSTKRALRGLATGVVLGAVVYAVADAVRPRPGPAVLVDWDDIREQAVRRLDPADSLDARRRRTLESQYRKLAGGLQDRLLEFVGGMDSEIPPFQALDRFGWVELNLGIMRDALDPILEVQQRLPNTRMLEIGRSIVDRYVGLILGFLANRVLGQYDPQLLGREPAGKPGLYLVESNIVEWQEEARLPGEPLRRWLILHEMTHAWQFGAHPWLRDHINSLIGDVIGAAIDRNRSPAERLLAMTVGVRRQFEVINRVQATMSLIEGYSNLVMDVVGREVLPEFEQLESAHHARSSEKTIFEKLFWKLTGLELKLQQYVIGEKFCQEVYQAQGMAFLNRAWEGPESLPALDEMKDSERWVRRIQSTSVKRPGKGA